jgi:hypothetical protein
METEGVPPMSAPTEVISDEEMERLSGLATAIYRDRLQAALEPIHDGKWVAIHLDTGDHALGPSSPDALRGLRKRHPHGFVVTRLVGPEREDPTLYRMLASQLARQRK